MPLTPAEEALLKTDIEANTEQVVVTALAAGDDGAIATWYNLDAIPDYWLFRNDVPSAEVRDAIDAHDIINMTDGDRGAVVDLLNIRLERGFSGAVDRDRSAWDDAFSTAAGDNSQQAILLLWTRLATNGEKVFSLSTGDGANVANADTTTFQGDLTNNDIRDALNSS